METRGLRVNMGKTKVMNCKVRQGQAVRQRTRENFHVEFAGKVLEETRYVAQNERVGFTKGVVGIGVDWKLQLAFKALTALKDWLRRHGESLVKKIWQS